MEEIKFKSLERKTINEIVDRIYWDYKTKEIAFWSDKENIFKNIYLSLDKTSKDALIIMHYTFKYDGSDFIFYDIKEGQEAANKIHDFEQLTLIVSGKSLNLAFDLLDIDGGFYSYKYDKEFFLILNIDEPWWYYRDYYTCGYHHSFLSIEYEKMYIQERYITSKSKKGKYYIDLFSKSHIDNVNEFKNNFKIERELDKSIIVSARWLNNVEPIKRKIIILNKRRDYLYMEEYKTFYVVYKHFTTVFIIK